MKYPDDIDFFYILENHGWSTCYLNIGGAMYEMGPTHIFNNPIEVLLDGFISIINGADEVTFKWHDEPGEYIWSIKRNLEQKHKVKISITNCFRLQPDAKPAIEELEFEVKLKLFSICILRQMEKIRDLMTEKSFREHRDREFPYSAFKEFKYAFLKEYSSHTTEPCGN